MNRPTSIERQQKKKEMIGPTGIVDGGGQGQGHPQSNVGKRTMEEGGEVGNGPANGEIIQQQNVIDHFREPPKRRKEVGMGIYFGPSKGIF